MVICAPSRDKNGTYSGQNLKIPKNCPLIINKLQMKTGKMKFPISPQTIEAQRIALGFLDFIPLKACFHKGGNLKSPKAVRP